MIAPLQQDATTHWGPTNAFAPRGTLMLTPAIQEPAVKVGNCPKNLAKPTNVLDSQTLASSSFLSAEDRTWATTQPPATAGPTINTNNSSTTNTVEEPRGSNATDNSTTTAPSPAGPVLNGSSEVLTGSTPASTTESRPPTSACCKNLLKLGSHFIRPKSSSEEKYGNIF